MKKNNYIEKNNEKATNLFFFYGCFLLEKKVCIFLY